MKKLIFILFLFAVIAVKGQTMTLMTETSLFKSIPDTIEYQKIEIYTILGIKVAEYHDYFVIKEFIKTLPYYYWNQPLLITTEVENNGKIERVTLYKIIVI